MADCPHCSKPIEALSGFIAQDKHTTQLAGLKSSHGELLAAKQSEIDLFAARVAELAPKASGYDAVATERDSWQAKYTAIEQRQERSGLLTAAGIATDKLEGMEQLWSSAMASKAEEERAAFPDWLGAEDGARTHPLLAGLFTAAAATETTETTEVVQPAAAQAVGLPRTAGPVTAPAPPKQGKMSAGDIRTMFASAEYRALKPEDQKAKLAELQAAHG